MTDNTDIIDVGILGDSADKWAVSFCQTMDRTGWGIEDIDQDLMLGWFANAIETATDHRSRQLSDETRKIVDIQVSPGNWNYDAYMHGMANGMLLMQSMIDGAEYAPLDAPDEWLADREVTPSIETPA